MIFYEPPHLADELKYDPFKAIISPRPIGWISTVSADGVYNLAPYSFFNAVASSPPQLMINCSQHLKDTMKNILETKEFVHNMVTLELFEQMNITSEEVGSEVDEFDLASLTPIDSRIVKAPRIKESPVNLECRYVQHLELKSKPKEENFLVIGEVVGVHIDESYIKEGRFDYKKAKMVARLGYKDYSFIDDIFEMNRPNER